MEAVEKALVNLQTAIFGAGFPKCKQTNKKTHLTALQCGAHRFASKKKQCRNKRAAVIGSSVQSEALRHASCVLMFFHFASREKRKLDYDPGISGHDDYR